MGKLVVMVLGVVVALAGCGGGGGAPRVCTTCPAGFECSALTEKCEQASGTLTWTLTDSCADGQDIQVAYFDTTNGLRFPADPSLIFTIPDGVTAKTSLACLPGATICYGAEPSGSSTKYWGADLAGDKGCTDCCASCGASQSVDLVCN